MDRVALVSFLNNNLSIRLLAACLKQAGFEATCVFCPAPLTAAQIERVLGLLSARGITLVGITLVTDDYSPAVALTDAVKASLNLPVIWGGAHPSIMPDECLRHADMVCVGEGEDVLLDLVRSRSNGGSPAPGTIANLCLRTAGRIVRNPLRDLQEDLDVYPFPDFDFSTQFLVEGHQCRTMESGDLLGVYSIMTSRGCPYSCRYCYNSYRRQQYKDKGNYLRLRSIGNVLAELRQAKARFPELTRVQFWDDTFLSRKPSDFEAFKQEYPGSVGLPFFALAEPMAFDSAKIKLLKECGLDSLQVGIQSGSERLNRQVYRRPVHNRDILAMAHALTQLGIVPTYDFIFNNPYETRQDELETVELVQQLPRPFQLQGYNLIFYPGSDLTNQALADGLIAAKTVVGDDFSTIQGEGNSAVSQRGKAVNSSRFYQLRYSSHDKAYLNSLVILASQQRAPRLVVNFFKRSENPFKRFLLRQFLALYLFLSGLKNRGRRQQ